MTINPVQEKKKKKIGGFQLVNWVIPHAIYTNHFIYVNKVYYAPQSITISSCVLPF